MKPGIARIGNAPRRPRPVAALTGGDRSGAAVIVP